MYKFIVLYYLCVDIIKCLKCLKCFPPAAVPNVPWDAHIAPSRIALHSFSLPVTGHSCHNLHCVILTTWAFTFSSLIPFAWGCISSLKSPAFCFNSAISFNNRSSYSFESYVHQAAVRVCPPLSSCLANYGSPQFTVSPYCTAKSYHHTPDTIVTKCPSSCPEHWYWRKVTVCNSHYHLTHNLIPVVSRHRFTSVGSLASQWWDTKRMCCTELASLTRSHKHTLKDDQIHLQRFLYSDKSTVQSNTRILKTNTEAHESSGVT